MKTSVTMDDITRAASSVGLELTDTEKNGILTHLSKQVQSFAVIDEVDTDRVSGVGEGGNDER